MMTNRRLLHRCELCDGAAEMFTGLTGTACVWSTDRRLQEQTELAQKLRYQSSNIATELAPASTFWPAEEYHQKYILKNGGGCH